MYVLIKEMLLSAMGQLVKDWRPDYWMVERTPSGPLSDLDIQVLTVSTRHLKDFETATNAAEMITIKCFISMLSLGKAAQIRMHKPDTLHGESPNC